MNPIGENPGQSRILDLGRRHGPATPAQRRAAELGLRESDGPTKSFAATAKQMIHEVDARQKAADTAITGLATGEVTDVHAVTVAAEEAQLSLNLMIEIRNRLLEAYQEVMRMQI